MLPMEFYRKADRESQDHNLTGFKIHSSDVEHPLSSGRTFVQEFLTDYSGEEDITIIQ